MAGAGILAHVTVEPGFDPSSPAQPEQPDSLNSMVSTPPRKRLVRLIVAAGVVAVAVVAGIGIAVAAGRSSGNRPTGGSSSTPAAPSLSPSPGVVGEAAACKLLYPALQEASDVMLVVLRRDDWPPPVDRGKVDQAISDLQTARQAASLTMQPDIDLLIQPLLDLHKTLNGDGDGDGVGGLDTYQEAEERLSITCARYARS